MQQQILDAAIRAPSGGNAQNWRFLLVDDPGVRGAIAPIYKDCIDKLWVTIYAERVASAQADPESDDSRQFFRVQASAQYLADHFADVPLLHVRLRAGRHRAAVRSIRPCGTPCSRHAHSTWARR